MKRGVFLFQGVEKVLFFISNFGKRSTVEHCAFSFRNEDCFFYILHKRGNLVIFDCIVFCHLFQKLLWLVAMFLPSDNLCKLSGPRSGPTNCLS